MLGEVGLVEIKLPYSTIVHIVKVDFSTYLLSALSLPRTLPLVVVALRATPAILLTIEEAEFYSLSREVDVAPRGRAVSDVDLNVWGSPCGEEVSAGTGILMF